MNHDFSELQAAARKQLGEITLGADRNAGTVAAAIETTSGQIFTGICLHLCCGIGTCAEHAAVLEMLKTRETRITKLVAVSDTGILAPCGRCRELLVQVDSTNMKTQIQVASDRIVTLSELLPDSWLPQN